ncbi:uncharacterized protein LOC108632783 [Ceratina calcarata]|uniref:Uncharacterized protein LOC108632783 n=1 Tax=Ceratina calcarata TaxID=156304 RepID=A0AAJ7JHK4_9HYME|nr:uncharacterized protein LOC108632783 [Ceratina calcarata]
MEKLAKKIEEKMNEKLSIFREEIADLLNQNLYKKDVNEPRILNETEKIHPNVADNLNIPAKTRNPQTWASVSTKKKLPRNEKGTTINKEMVVVENKRTNEIKKNNVPTLRRPKGSVAVYIVREKGCEYDMAQIMSEAKKNIKLTDIGIDSLRPRTSLNGGLILEIPKKGMEMNAEILATEMADVLAGKKVKITCPKKTKELVITNLDIATNENEILEAIKKESGSKQEVEIGKIRLNNRGTGAVWIKCSEETAFCLLTKGKLQIGWSEVRFQEIDKRPIQCYKCWHFGHTRIKCTSEIDRQGWCYKCGGSEHTVRQCNATSLICRICEEANLQHNHRMGSKECPTLKRYKSSIPNKANVLNATQREKKNTALILNTPRNLPDVDDSNPQTECRPEVTENSQN